MRSFGRNTPQAEIKAVEAKLAEAKQQFTAITTEAAKAGAAIESDFKNKIRSASSVVNDFTAKIIEQKSVVKDVEHDVRKLGEAYQKALKSDSSNATSIKADYDAAKKALSELSFKYHKYNENQVDKQLVKALARECAEAFLS